MILKTKSLILLIIRSLHRNGKYMRWGTPVAVQQPAKDCWDVQGGAKKVIAPVQQAKSVA